MLTGDTPMSAGRVTIDGFDVRKQAAQVRQRIGYCPQFDGLIGAVAPHLPGTSGPPSTMAHPSLAGAAQGN